MRKKRSPPSGPKGGKAVGTFGTGKVRTGTGGRPVGGKAGKPVGTFGKRRPPLGGPSVGYGGKGMSEFTRGGPGKPRSIRRWAAGSDMRETLAEMRASDHAYNVAQREHTKSRLVTARGKTKAHIDQLKAKGASVSTIKKARAKAQDRYDKIKGKQKRRRTMV